MITPTNHGTKNPQFPRKNYLPSKFHLDVCGDYSALVFVAEKGRKVHMDQVMAGGL